jgi:hypothetical protein
MTAIFRIAAVSAALAVSGCLTSDGLLFDQKNARALAFEEGRYDACQQDSPTDEPDCKGVDVTRDSTGLYAFQIDEEGESPTYTRFKRIGSGAWAAQLWGPGDDHPFYFLTTKSGAEMTFSMIDCESLPESFKSRYVKRGQLEVQDSSTCVAKTAGVVVAAAKAWRTTDASKTGARIVYRKAA